MKKRLLSLIALSMLTGSTTLAHAADNRDAISIVGSSTVYPFATAVAEQFGKTSAFKTPKVESTGTGGGIKLFCAGAGRDTPDITNASRAIKASELESCVKNGVSEIVEVKIGYDGIVLANSKKAQAMPLSRKELFLALAKNVPNPQGGDTLIPNPYKTWNEINPKLPANKIVVLGPSPVHGTRDTFVEMVMEHGASSFASIKNLKENDEKQFKAVCQTLREDGAYVEVSDNYNLIVQKLESDPKALGIFGFSYLDQNAEKIQAATIDGEKASIESITSGNYPVSRPLFLYVKKEHIGKVAGIVEYLAEFTSDRAWGEEGYLADKGLIPLKKEERKSVAADTKALKSVVVKAQ